MKEIYEMTDCQPSFKMASGINDNFTIVGNVDLTLLDTEGKVVNEYIGSNQIVNIGRYTVAKLVCNLNVPIPTEAVLNTLRVAGGAVHEGGDHMNPTNPSIIDPDLFETNPTKVATYLLDPPILSADSPDIPPLVTFTKLVTSQDINMLVNEVGMYFGLTGPMFAHYTFPSMDLRVETGNALEIRWKFTF